MEFYKTMIYTYENKTNYDLEEECNIIIKLLDYNDKPIKNKRVRIKIESLISGEVLYLTDNEGNEYITNSNGLVTIPYSSRVPNRFVVECNNTSFHILYDGWYHEETGAYFDLYYSLDWCKIVFKGSVPNVTAQWKEIGTIQSDKLPILRMVTQVNWGDTILVGLGLEKNKVLIRDTRDGYTGSWTPGISAEITYPYLY